MGPRTTFSGVNEILLIRLHWSTFAYTRLVTSLHCSTFVYTRLVTRLYSPTLVK